MKLALAVLALVCLSCGQLEDLFAGDSPRRWTILADPAALASCSAICTGAAAVDVAIDNEAPDMGSQCRCFCSTFSMLAMPVKDLDDTDLNAALSRSLWRAFKASCH